jgi:predicted dehydrogenase
VIGNVKEVHAWTDRPIWPQGIADRLPAEAPPSDLAWDLFLGPAADRPYNKDYTPFKWRGWFDFGCGALGDMACHILDPANWALGLRDPLSIECVKQEGRTKECFPTKSIVKFEFGPRGAMPPVTVYWYDGGWLPPRPEGIPEDSKLGEGKNGSLFIGDKGMITTGTYGEGTRLLPEALMQDFKAPEKILTRSPGHYRDFIRACKGGDPACSHFDYAGPFTEWVVLGTIAQRVDGKLLWDAKKLEFTNNPAASAYTKPFTRPGWDLPAV